MGISADKGVVVSWFVNSHFNTVHMKNFLRALSNIATKRSWIFMDNAPWHRSKGTADEIKRLKLRCNFNKPYNPEFNPIESVFGTLKQELRS